MKLKNEKEEPLHQPVFIVGYPRSGTTFLEKFLHEYLCCSMCNETNFILHAFEMYQKHGGNVHQVVDRILNHPFFRRYGTIYSRKLGKDVSITKAQILERISSPTLPEIIYAILDRIRENCKKNFVLAKDPGLSGHLDILHAIFPRAKIIHVIRDGRDCALSMREVNWGDGNIAVTACNWKKTVTSVRGHADFFPGYIEVFYERLLTQPKTECDRMQVFLNQSTDEQISQKFASEMESSRLRGNFNKWADGLSEREIRTFESIAGELLQTLGYSTACRKRKRSRLYLHLLYGWGKLCQTGRRKMNAANLKY